LGGKKYFLGVAESSKIEQLKRTVAPKRPQKKKRERGGVTLVNTKNHLPWGGRAKRTRDGQRHHREKSRQEGGKGRHGPPDLIAPVGQKKGVTRGAGQDGCKGETQSEEVNRFENTTYIPPFRPNHPKKKR